MSQSLLVWCFFGPALLLALSVPLTHAIMRGAIALRKTRTSTRDPLRPEQATYRYQQFRALKPYRSLLQLTGGQRVLIACGLALDVVLTVIAFVVGNLSRTAPDGHAGGDSSPIPTPNFDLSPASGHALFIVLLAVGSTVGIVAIWMLLFGRVVNLYRADWYRAGLTDAEHAQQKAIRKSVHKTAAGS